MNWTRGQLKNNAKLMVKKNYGLCCVVSLLVTLIAGGGVNYNININNRDAEGLAQSFASNFGGQWSAYALRILPALGALVSIIVILSILFRLLVGNVLLVGSSRFYLHNIHSMGEMGDLAFGFRNQFGNVVMVMFRRELSVFLWSLLLVIPGVIKEYQYMLVPYLMADNPELSWQEAAQTSRDMMVGEKMNAFVLRLSFILWDLLSAITFGIVGFLWVYPYEAATMAELYTAIKARYSGQSF